MNLELRAVPLVAAFLAAVITAGCGAAVGPSVVEDAGTRDAGTRDAGTRNGPTPPDAREPADVAPLPQPCVAQPQIRAGGVGSGELREAPCTSETLSSEGCVITRTARTLDSAGRIATERFEIVDPSRFQNLTFQRITNTFTTFERDSSGRIVRETEDAEIDGAIDVVTLTTYDTTGRVRVRERRTTGADPAEPGGSVSRTEFDEGGRETLIENRSGMFSESTRTTFDTAGRELARVERQNDTVVALTTWIRRADGQLLHRTRARPSGEMLDETLWTYDSAGRSSEREERDLFSSGRHARMRVTRYDAAARIVLEREDYPRDGVDDAVHEIDYDADGHRVRERRHVIGFAATETFWTYDSRGRVATSIGRAGPRVIETAFAYAADGTVTSTEVERSDMRPVGTTTRVSDAAGREVSRTVDRLSDGSIEQRARHVFDAAGHELLAEEDLDADGRPDVTQRWYYDTAGRMVAREFDTNGDGALDVNERWTYDSVGNSLEHRNDSANANPAGSRSDFGCYGG